MVSLAAIAVGLVHLRRREVTVQHRIQRMRLEHVAMRRKLWDQQVELGFLTGPQEIQRRMEGTSLTRLDTARRLEETPPRE